MALLAALALGALAAPSAFASSKPSVETKPATGITGDRATLNGIVNPNGAETKYYFEYGTTTAYGIKTTEATAGSGTTGLAETGVARGGPNTTYHFRVVATNSNGTTDGADEVFSTTPAERPEAVVAAGKKITELEVAASGGSMYIEWSARKSLTCSSSTFSGHFINSTQLEGTMRLSNCYQATGGVECQNERLGGKGAIKSELLIGTLGYLSKSKKEVGLKLAGKSSEIWANKVNCLGSTYPLTGALGGLLELPVNTKIPAGGAFKIGYTEKEDTQLTGELGGQLLWEAGATQFGIGDSLNASANKEFEIQA